MPDELNDTVPTYGECLQVPIYVRSMCGWHAYV